MYLVIERPWVQRPASSIEIEAPVGHHKLPGLADGVCQELDGRLRQGDGREAEGVERVDAAAEDAEGDPNHPHADREARKGGVILLQADASGDEDIETWGVRFVCEEPSAIASA